MELRTWRSIAAGGAVFIITCAALGRPYIQVAFQMVAAAVVLSMVWGVRQYKPKRTGIWWALAVSGAVFFVSYGSRLLIGSWWPTSTWDPLPPDFLDALAFAFVIVGAHLAGRVRDRYKDPTTVIDSMILTGGLSAIAWIAVILPYAHDHRFSVPGRYLQVGATLLALWLFFVTTRLVLGPGAKTLAFRPFALAAVCGMGSQVSGSALGGAESTACVAFGALALLCLCLTALHPTMTAVTERSDQGIGRMTKKRLALMGLAVLTAPLVMVVQEASAGLNLESASGLVASWMVVTALVMLRLSGLVRARERMARLEHTLRRAAGSLAAATDRNETYDAALAAMMDIATRDGSSQRSSVLLCIDGTWQVVGSRGEGGGAAIGRNIEDEAISKLFSGGHHEIVRYEHASPVDMPMQIASSVTAAPMLFQGQLRGVLAITSASPLSDEACDALDALSSDVSLALEATTLAEDLHKRQGEARLHALLQHSSDVTAVLDGAGLITYVTPSAESVLGHHPDALVGSDLSSILHPEDQHVIEQLVMLLVPGQVAPKQVELRVADTKGGWKTLDVTVTDLREELSVNGIVINAHDVTERKELEQDLRHKVLHDDLTGIANRVLFRERVHHALASRKTDDHTTAILFIDLDDFKTVNDGLGHGAGDELLKVIAFRMESFVRGGDTAARLGGDEFAVLMENFYSADDVANAAKRLLAVVQEPVIFGDRQIQVTASVGIAFADADSTAEVLLRNADVAMYHAKGTGKGRVRTFDEEMYESAFERLELKGELLYALERNELSLAYQPLVSLATGELEGFEALMRWTHPTRGFVSPAQFIPLAEETGLIVEIGAWALKVATAQLAEWRRSMPGLTVGMSVNVSPRQLDSDEIVNHVRSAIDESGIDPSWLTLELTEGSGLEDPLSRERLIGMRALGCGIAADDFGTGFASYAALQQLPFTNVKIDKSLIDGLASADPRAQAQVRSIIQMGHALGLTITAEGIEEPRQRDTLSSMGADKGQGYLFSRPMATGDATEWVRQASGVLA